ncbi:uncharacterized protein CIMG_07496 [Coccidioides immitis RS]|uniref:BTB domain-containing protein n=1 Tax=Coccidioides immitis (strain RS) TaxID=246410 RepID=J3K3I4_COCIM|nr:uncharacterized protein CIMG_07496 [Coccidioides immitis RS]EAS28750.3 hypothetical protein CIMG_07496 [Coccidioides immitis RS]
MPDTPSQVSSADVGESERITLQVGDRQFYTTIESLVERSRYFATLFSGKWPVSKEDGSIFVDADGSVFEYVLQYLRRGVFPLAFCQRKGHNYSLYMRLLEEARYFQCPLLISWLEDKCYYKCVRWRVLTRIQDTVEPNIQGQTSVRDWQIVPQLKRKEKVYICPRWIDVHRGNLQKFGRQYRNAKGEGGPEYDTENVTSEWLVARARFHPGWITDSGAPFLAHWQTRRSRKSL